MAGPTPAAPQSSEIINVLDQGGEMHGVPAQHLDDVLRSGAFRVATPQEVTAYWRHQDYGGVSQGLASAAEGAASALTLGVAPHLEIALGITTPEAMAARKEEHPILHGAGEVAGVLAPLALTGGAAGAAEGAARAGAEAAPALGEGAAAAAPAVGEAAGAGLAAAAPSVAEAAGAMAPAAAEAAPGIMDALRGGARFTGPGLISKAGQSVRGAVEGAELPGFLGRIAPVAAQGAVEGGLYGGADIMERQALKDPGLTGESAAVELGLGSLFGGSLMGLGKVAGEGFGALLGKASKGLQTVGERLATGDKATVRLMMENRGALGQLQEVAPKVADEIQASSPETAAWIFKNAKEIAKREQEFPGLTKLLSRADPDTGQLVLDNWGNLLKDPQRRIEVGTAMQDAAQSAYTSIGDALKTINTKIRPAETEALLSGPHTVELPGGGSALEVVEPEVAQKAGQRILGRVENTIEKMTAEPDLYEPAYRRQLELFRDGLQRDAGGSPSDIFQRLREFRMQLDGAIPYERDLKGLAERNAVSEFKGLRATVKGALTDESTWGQAGARQAAYDAAMRDFFQAKKGFERFLMDGPKGAKVVSPSKINSWLNLAADLRGKAKNTAFDDFLDAGRGLAGEMEKAGYEGASTVRQAVDTAASQAEQVRQKAVITQIVKMLQGKPILSSGPAIPDLLGQVVNEAATHAAHRVLPFGLTGMITGSVDRLRSPGVTIGVLNALDKMAQKTSKAMSGGVGRIFEGEAAAAAGTAPRAVTPETYPNAAADLQRHGGDLGALAETVSQHTAGIEVHAPATADTLHALAARGVQHLQALLPQGPAPLPLTPDYRPSVAELTPLNRAHEIAANPLAILDHLRRGTLDLHHVQAAEAIWPRLTQEMRVRVLEGLAARKAAGKVVPRHARLSLAMFLGQDLDRSTTQATIAANQAAFAGAPKPQTPGAIGGGGGDGKGAGKAKAIRGSSTRFATASQRMLDRDIG